MLRLPKLLLWLLLYWLLSECLCDGLLLELLCSCRSEWLLLLNSLGAGWLPELLRSCLCQDRLPELQRNCLRIELRHPRLLESRLYLLLLCPHLLLGVEYKLWLLGWLLGCCRE